MIAPVPRPLTGAEKRYLLRLARAAVTAAAAGRRPPAPEQIPGWDEVAGSPVLREPRGAFVTLHRDGRLRGCIGYIQGIKPLVEAVVDNAVSAAVSDPRFLPVVPDEVPHLEIEVSVLSPLQPVSSWREIEIPRHGIVLRHGPAHAVFLPQVAAEQGWDLPTTLSHLALKAGLPPDAWRDGATFEVFTAEVFAEETS